MQHHHDNLCVKAISSFMLCSFDTSTETAVLSSVIEHEPIEERGVRTRGNSFASYENYNYKHLTVKIFYPCTTRNHSLNSLLLKL